MSTTIAPPAEDVTTLALDCRDLHKEFGDRTAVDSVTFTIEAGECYGLLGPNGAGKTTTISMICGLIRPDRGQVQVCGVTMSPSALEAKQSIGYVPQELALYPDLSASDNLRFFGRLYGLHKHVLEERLGDVLDTVGLADRAGDAIGSFSGGMKRRINIAAGLLHSPRLLILDEPTVGVDPQSRNAILETVSALTEAGMAVLYTTHYMEEASRLCRRVGIIDSGRLVAEGTRHELIASIDGQDKVRVTGTGSPSALVALAERCRELAGVKQVTATEDGIELAAEAARHLLPDLIAAASQTEVTLASVEVAEPNLEDVFLALTGKELRD